MAGTYEIVSKVDHPTKFACYVKFNEDLDSDFYSATDKNGDALYPEGGEYWECESTDATEISTLLQATADANAEIYKVSGTKATLDAIEVLDGKIIE